MFFSVLVPDGSKGASMLGVCGKGMRLTHQIGRGIQQVGSSIASGDKITMKLLGKC